MKLKWINSSYINNAQMTKIIQDENRRLRHQLQSLLDEARVNENKWHRLNQFEKQLIATRTLPELIQVMLQGYKSAYEMDVVTLVLSDPEYEITRTLEREKCGSSNVPGLVIMEKLNSNIVAPYLGPIDTELNNSIFDPWPSGCCSMALLPLKRRDGIIGSLNMASKDPSRFTADSSTDFLERLTAVFSICLENTLNNERLKLVGLTDHLTRVFNRRYFETRCLEEVANARRHHRPLACMFLDIDKFKLINDNYGHLAGDEVLRTVASMIQSQLRNNDVIARYGGEEFVVLLPRTVLRQACEIAERIRSTVADEALRITNEKSLRVTISIGISMLPEKLIGNDVECSQNLISSADGALYRAKENGRNRVEFVETEPIPEVAMPLSLVG